MHGSRFILASPLSASSHFLSYKCEARLDDSIYIETTFLAKDGGFRRYLLKPVLKSVEGGEGSAAHDPSCVAWLWVKNFSDLAALHGHAIAGPTRADASD